MNLLRDHLAQRELLIDLYRSVIIDEENQIVTFLLYNLSGQIVGYQEYSPIPLEKWGGNRYDTQVGSLGFPCWGMETYNYRNDILFLVEGIFDACKLHNLGYPAIATLNNNPLNLWPWLLSLSRNRKRIVICDNDKAGSNLSKFGHQYKVVTSPYKDLGDMTIEEVFIFTKEFIC